MTSHPASRPRPFRVLRRPLGLLADLSLGLIGLAIGAALYIAGSSVLASAEPAESAVVVAPLDPGSPGAASAADAVVDFLDAEVAGNEAAAWSLLSDDDRLAYPSPAIWADRSVLGPVTDWEWLDRSALTTELTLDAGLSLTGGWTPNAVVVTWQTVEQNGHRVTLAASVTESVLIDTGGALAAADAWLIDPDRCAAALPAALAPTSATFERLCVSGGVSLAESAPVSGQLAVDLSLAYGSGVDRWARSVPLETGESLVVAAIGSDWVVIDAVTR